MTFLRQQLGESGEELACRELGSRGYAIVARRYRTRYGEIDIVARDGDFVVFVEVKLRTTGEFGAAAESVTPWKQRRVVAMAVDYLSRNGLTDRPCRFDVVAVDMTDSAEPKITVFAAAFEAC
jgi:putative endonuclease